MLRHGTSHNPSTSRKPMMPQLVQSQLEADSALDGPRLLLPQTESRLFTLTDRTKLAGPFSETERQLSSPILLLFLEETLSLSTPPGAVLLNSATSKLTSCSSSMNLDQLIPLPSDKSSNSVQILQELTLLDLRTLLWVLSCLQPVQDW